MSIEENPSLKCGQTQVEQEKRPNEEWLGIFERGSHTCGGNVKWIMTYEGYGSLAAKSDRPLWGTMSLGLPTRRDGIVKYK